MQRSVADLLREVEQTMGETWLPQIYRERILKSRTRAYEFAAQAKTEPQIQHTLLGIELKVGRRRLLCPDLATARYLAVFARAGCNAVAIPYDITEISHVADALESSWHRMLLVANGVAPNRSTVFCARLRNALIGKVRNEIEEAGAGPRVPEFKQSTKQRRQGEAQKAEEETSERS